MTANVKICGDNNDYDLLEIVDNISIYWDLMQEWEISEDEFAIIKVELLWLK